eukprot:jgi/Astpho2/1561/Aster-05432
MASGSSQDSDSSKGRQRASVECSKKVQKRRQGNREAAARLRRRRQVHVESLQARCDELETDKRGCLAQLLQLTAYCKHLMEVLPRNI